MMRLWPRSPNRFIPTAVGNAGAEAPRREGLSVHPHGCGERQERHSIIKGSDGSSPRLWGTLCGCPSCNGDIRFIPTAVGNALANHRAVTPTMVHPHGCGERSEPEFPVRQSPGSSPRLWGTLQVQGHFLAKVRFIPTAVGNAGLKSSMLIHLEVHPHGCGERVYYWSCVCRWPGSSPRLWGTPDPYRLGRERQRFIPTAVGNAHGSRSLPDRRAVHPHGCGERTNMLRLHKLMAGSSPRLWGTQIGGSHIDDGLRFIPTAVGNAGLAFGNMIFYPVHPHGCGERLMAILLTGVLGGSSPRL